ncbi:AMP-binding protein [Verrucomicrobiaceae bacterium R5-34]|nr:AMP-binding protein [Verrucomicrobiaceae bacterium R5-34]
MEASDLTSSEFWSSTQPWVIPNPRDSVAVAEAEIIQPWLEQQAGLQGHLLFRTSGSTGKGKWVALSRSALLASARAVNEFLQVTPNDRWLLTLPLFHVGGFGIAARSYLAGCLMLQGESSWDAERCYDRLCEESITLTSLVPAQLGDLVGLGRSAPPSLRAVLIGGGRTDDSIYQQAVELGWPVHETYGMTETASQVATAPTGGRQLQILPHWQVGTDEHQLLKFQGEALFSAYVGCDQGRCFIDDPKQDGWFISSDRGEVASGILTVMGRADRCVKVLGELVDLSEVESTLKRVADEAGLSQRELIVTAVQPPKAGEYRDQRRGTLLVLCTDQDDGLASLLEKYNAVCPALQRIKGIAVLGEIPRTAIGKIDYPLIQQLLQSDQ